MTEAANRQMDMASIHSEASVE